MEKEEDTVSEVASETLDVRADELPNRYQFAVTKH
jgi:hypothetical protein